MRRFPALFALFALVAAGSIPSGAQTVSVVARDTAIIAAPASIVTTALRITNRTADRVALVPRITAPAEWSVPNGTLPFALAGNESDTWIISIRVPARAPAGRYIVAVSAADSAGRMAARDSIVVVVSAVHGLELALTNRPTYSVSGEMYRATFILQNRGNGTSAVTLAGTSSLGGRVSLDSTRLTLGAGETRSVTARVSTHMKGLAANDDVVEITAVDNADTSVTATASARVTIVQEANTAEPLHKVASTLRLRAAESSAGVSPFELVGAGALRDGGSERLSFVMRGSPGRQSQFGDQAEYRVELAGNGFRARVGDGLYKASELTTSGQMGAGAGVDVSHGIYSAGAFAQSYRHQFDAPTEQGVYGAATRADLFGAPTMSLSAVSRNGRFAGQVLGSKLSMTPVAGTEVDVEVAGSTGPLGGGAAATARVSGGGDALHYDLAHVAASDNFAGLTRGTSHDFASVSATAAKDLRVSATVASHGSSGVSFGLAAPQTFNVSTLMVEYASRASIQYSSATRESSFGDLHFNEAQRGVLARSEETFGKLRLWGAAGAGVATTGDDTHGYHEFTLGGATSYGENTISLYGETSDGMSLTRGGNHLMTVGGDIRAKVGPSTYFSVTGFQSSVLNTGERYAQLDGGISQALRTGSTVSLRVRLAGNNRVGNHQIAFIEYAMPLGMPVGRMRTAGRVRGRVVDQETGRGVAGTLVRLGPQAAITDAEGNVAFAGLPAGEYRLTLAQQASQTPSVFTGGSTVVVDSSARPTTFSLAIERAGTVQGNVRQMIIARTGVESVPDSLADGGALNGISLALIGARDTLYVTTDAAGNFSFPEVASGTWVLRVTSDAPLGARWEPAETAVVVKPAATQKVVFRSTPRRREVRMTSGEIIQAKQQQQK